MTATFLCLYGTASPLPTFYTEDLMEEASEDESATRDFIDILNHQLYLLLFESWLKYRQSLQVMEEKRQAYTERLYCLLGLGETKYRENVPNTFQLLRYIGLFSQAPRSAMGLQTLLSDALKLPVQVISCVNRKAKIPEDQLLRLGNAVLGENSVVGSEIEDRMGKFRLRIGPIDADAYRRFFPGSDAYNQLVSLVALFVLEPLDYDLEVYMHKNQAKTTCLGDRQWSQLGLDTWVFAGNEIGEVKNTYYPKLH